MVRRIITVTMIAAMLLSVLSSCASNGGKGFASDEIINSVALDDDNREWLTENINDFALNSAHMIFQDETNRNILYSPASLYMALSMLYELSTPESETRKEIRGLLQPIDEGDQADLCDALYQNMVYRSEGGKLKIGNSIWASADVATELPKERLQLIEDAYHGSVHTTDLDNTAEIENWIREMTDGELSQLPYKPESGEGLLLLNTILFQDEWVDRFSESANKEDVFYLADSREISCTYMRQTDADTQYIYADAFTAARLHFRNGFAMHFILPANGLLPADILENPEFLFDAIDYSGGKGNIFRGEVAFEVPKLKFKSSLMLTDAIRKMGMTRVFDLSGDFPASLFVTGIYQDTRFEMDEKGAKAIAITEIPASSAAPPPPGQILDFTLNRPFVFVITSREGYVVFTGIVNNPTLSE